MKRIFFLLALFVFTAGLMLQAQTVQISGVVTSSEDGSVIPGVTIVVKGTTVGTVTNFNGAYTLAVPQSATTLVCSFVGMKTQEVAIEGRTTVDVILEADVYSLEELVVVGYGVQRKREVTGSISQVKGDDIGSLATPSFESQLAGRAAGVQVTTGNGVLGTVPRIRIRGNGSITSGEYPLIVVDGIPIFTGDQGGYADNNSLGDVNPSDIESIEILKDGSATAIYGSRAANGVILITTKRGVRGKMSMTYNNYYGIAQPVRLFDLLNAEESILINNEKRSNKALGAIAFAAGAAGPAVDTDWQLAVLRQNAIQQDHNISLSGGNEMTSYYFSLGYTDQEGVTRPNEMQRFSFKANIDQKVLDWLSVGTTLGMTQSEYFGLNTGGNALSGNIFSAIRQLPNTPIYDENNPLGYSMEGNLVGRYNNTATIGDNLPNIIFALDNNRFESKILRTIANVYASANILPSLNFRTQLSADIASTEGALFYDSRHGDGFGVNGRVQNNYRNASRATWQNILSFNETFAGAHNLGVTLVNEFQTERINSFFAVGTDLSDNFFKYNIISGSYGTPNSGGALYEGGYVSYAGRLNYNYAGKYFIQASLRRDGISDMPEANKYGVFPGASVGWSVSSEPFMEGLNFLTDMKLRASWAEVGNTSVGAFPYAGLYGAARYADNNGIAFVQMGNDQLQWETSKKYGAGLDLILMDGKYQFTFDYFVNDIDNLILEVPTPPSFGIPGNLYNANIGSMRNSGLEFSGEAFLVRTSDYSISLNGNLSFVANEVTFLTDDQKQIFEALPTDDPGFYTITKVGESIRSIYGYDYVGVNAANGNPIYRKANGDLVQGNIATSTYRVYNPESPADVSQSATLSSVDDKIVLGSSLPTYFGAVGANMTFKGFDANLMFRFSGGNVVMNRTRMDLLGQNFTNNGKEILGRWQSAENPGDGWTPKLSYQDGNFINIDNQSSSRFVEKGDFFKFQNLILGYTLPKSVVNKVGIQNLRIFAQGQELFMITDYTGIDPEMEVHGVDYNGTPRQRTITFGINLTL